MQRARAKASRAEDLAAGLAGAAWLLPIELVSLARSSSGDFGAAAWAVTGLFAGLGVLVGLALALGNHLAARAAHPLGASLVRAAPALLVLVPATSSLFDGAWAATLPGAQLGHLWAPLLGYGVVVVAVHAGCWLARLPLGRAALGIALPGLAVEIDLGNRTLLASEYADLHTLLLVTSVVLGGVGLRWFVTAFAPLRRHWPQGTVSRRLAAVMGGAAALAALTLGAGLSGKAARRSIADNGMHGRLLDRAAKGLFDFDRDGHAPVLGGRDCRPFQAAVHPDAVEIGGNGVDEDCDGQDRAGLPGADETPLRRQRVAAWRQEPDVTAIAQRLARLNVVFVVVDALRADPFAPNPENAAAFPNVFALRGRASWFNHAFSTAAGTDVSMAGLMTGRINPLSGAELTLAEGLGAAGYTTHAIVPAEVLRSASRTLLTRGFANVEVLKTDGIKKTAGDISADRTTARALAFIDRWKAAPRGPFFLWTHYFDVHEHGEFPADLPAIVASNRGAAPANRVEKYRALISIVDGAVGRLRDGLAARGLADNTALVFVSDHGESMREDRRLPENHGRFLYNPLVNVPLAIVLPGIEPVALTTAVTLLDVPATFFDLIGANDAAGDIDGESLLPHLLGAPSTVVGSGRVLPLNETDQFGLIAWPYKLLVRPEANFVELFDVSRDFREQIDLADEQPALVTSLQQSYRGLPALRLDRTLAARRRWETKAEATRPNAAQLARLARALRASAPEGADRAWLPGGRPATMPAIAIAKTAGRKAAGEGRTAAGQGQRHADSAGAAILASPQPTAPVHAGIIIEPLQRPAPALPQPVTAAPPPATGSGAPPAPTSASASPSASSSSPSSSPAAKPRSRKNVVRVAAGVTKPRAARKGAKKRTRSEARRITASEPSLSNDLRLH